jgi:hypothetical protein
MYFAGRDIVSVIPSSTSGSFGVDNISIERKPTDPLFWTSIRLDNIVIGSSYWLSKANDNTIILAHGIATSSTVELTDIPSTEDSMLIKVRVRKSTVENRYFPYETYGYLIRNGLTIYIAQVKDTILNE